MPRYREPKCCLRCCTDEATKGYEGKVHGNYLKPDAGKIKDLVLMERFNSAEWMCAKCGLARAVETTVPLGWNTCKSHGKHITVKEGKCVLCNRDDEEIVFALNKIKASRGEK